MLLAEATTWADVAMTLVEGLIAIGVIYIIAKNI